MNSSSIYTDDGEMPAKPDPYCIYALCEKERISKTEIIMVGDTLTDTRFAKNGGIKVIGVAQNDENKRILEMEADVVIPDISYIFEVIE